jgi:hypothetical protein
MFYCTAFYWKGVNEADGFPIRIGLLNFSFSSQTSGYFEFLSFFWARELQTDSSRDFRRVRRRVLMNKCSYSY